MCVCVCDKKKKTNKYIYIYSLTVSNLPNFSNDVKVITVTHNHLHPNSILNTTTTTRREGKRSNTHTRAPLVHTPDRQKHAVAVPTSQSERCVRVRPRQTSRSHPLVGEKTPGHTTHRCWKGGGAKNRMGVKVETLSAL